MGRINRTSVEEKVKKKLLAKLWKALSSFDSPERARDFWEKFLTPSEVLILAKRLELFRKAAEGRPYSKIKEELKVGSITISRARNALREHGAWFRDWILRLTV